MEMPHKSLSHVEPQEESLQAQRSGASALGGLFPAMLYLILNNFEYFS